MPRRWRRWGRWEAFKMQCFSVYLEFESRWLPHRSKARARLEIEQMKREAGL